MLVTNYHEMNRSIMYVTKDKNNYLLIEYDKNWGSHNTIFMGTLKRFIEYLEDEIDYLSNLINNTTNKNANKVYTMFINVYSNITDELV